MCRSAQSQPSPGSDTEPGAQPFHSVSSTAQDCWLVVGGVENAPRFAGPSLGLHGGQRRL